MDLEDGIRMQLESMIGERFVIVHLASARGAALNGRRCVVTGRDGRRAAVEMLDDGAAFRCCCNLMPEAEASAYTPPHGAGVPEPELLRRLAEAADSLLADHSDVGTSERGDIRARAAYVKGHVAAGRVPPPPRCGDTLMAPAEQEANPFVLALAAARPACCGDGSADFRRFNAGLVGGGGECAVCTEPLGASQRALGFPCGHEFHEGCAKPWLAGHSTCPTCRFQLSMPGLEYALMLGDYEAQLTARLREWFISGFCERCQAKYMEADPFMVIPDANGGPSLLVRRSHMA
ncbi:hypothetical protein Rsub_06814 [Raphidocelis subcapitata]|uniref:RING-type domain-containing protein n=1 Tax=Raphidocelis subcapitata TaxID=307507 RepID=A0A2V0P1E8_9CHLO|nr:hypothetical protein Rsub_06814 [Raphidocelis subcapitata]|eukprot:GBF93711.1 hypothetical protein Rsub_06814 [Raphidocelis subcapitata]